MADSRNKGEQGKEESGGGLASYFVSLGLHVQRNYYEE